MSTNGDNGVPEDETDLTEEQLLGMFNEGQPVTLEVPRPWNAAASTGSQVTVRMVLPEAPLVGTAPSVKVG